MSRETPLCSVLGCSNNKKSSAQPATFYYLPKDKLKGAKWKQALDGHISNDTLSTKTLICTQHFEKDNFEANGLDLTNNAVPSIFPVLANSDEPPNKVVKFYTVEIRKDITKIENVVESPTPDLSSDVSDLSSIDSDLSSFEDTSISDDSNYVVVDYSKQSEDELQAEIKNLETLKGKLICEQNWLIECEKELTSSLSLIEKEIQSTELETKSVSDEQLDTLKKCLSPSQIRHLIGKDKAKWSLDDISVAYTISSMVSHDFYSYMREHLKMPLPSLSNITRHYTKSGQESVKGSDMNCM